MKRTKLFLISTGLLLNISASAKIPMWWNVSPAGKETVKEISVIKIDNEDYSDTFRAEKDAELLINEESVDYTVSYEMCYGYDDDTMVLTLVDPITEDGEYTIKLPEGFFTYIYYGYGSEDLSVSPEFEWTVTVENNGGEDDPFETSIPYGFSVSPSEDSEAESISSITLSGEEGGYEGFSARKPMFDIKINGTDLQVVPAISTTSITMTLSEAITTAGTYNIEIPAGVFTYESGWATKENQPFKWIVKVVDKGVESDIREIGQIDSDEEDVEIYTIDGLRVNEMLPRQIYIVKKGERMFKIIHRAQVK